MYIKSSFNQILLPMSNQPNNKQVSLMAIACVTVIAITMMVLTAMMNVANAQDYLNPSRTDAVDSPFAEQCFRQVGKKRNTAFYFSEFGEVFIDHIEKSKNGKIKVAFDEADMTWRYNPETGKVVVRGAYYSLFVEAMTGNGWVRANFRGSYDGRVMRTDDGQSLVRCKCYRY